MSNSDQDFDMQEMKKVLYAVLGETVHTLSEVRQLIAPLIEQYGEKPIHAALDRYYFVMQSNLSGEKFATFVIVDPDEPGDDDAPRFSIDDDYMDANT